MTKRLTTRGQAGVSLLAFGVLLMAASGAMVFRAAPAYAGGAPVTTPICHNSSQDPLDPHYIPQDATDPNAHLVNPQGHPQEDIIAGFFNTFLGRVATAADVAICGDATTTTTTSTTTTTTLGSTTTTTLGSTTTTTLGGPCSPTDPECLPNTGGSNLMSVLLAGLGLLLAGVGLLAMANERRRVLTP